MEVEVCMSVDCMSKGVCVGVLLLVVFVLSVCGIVIVVCFLGSGGIIVYFML